MNVQQLIEQLNRVEDKSLPVHVVDPYSDDKDDEWELADEHALQIVRGVVELHIGTRVGDPDTWGEEEEES